MAELRSTTAIGGNLIWHEGNLRLDPQGNTMRYGGYKFYSEYDKPDPHVDLTESVVKRAGDLMTGTLNLQKVGEVLRIDGGSASLDNSDSWIHMGTATYGWQLKYQGSTSGAGGNEFVVQSTNQNTRWSFDHDGNMDYITSSNSYRMLHTGNIDLIDARYVNTSGDTMTGDLATSGSVTATSFLHTSNSGTWLSFGGTLNATGEERYINNDAGDNIVRLKRNSANDYDWDVYGKLKENGQRVYSPNNRNISTSLANTSTTTYAAISAVKSTNDNANTRVLRSGDTMSGNLSFPTGRGIRNGSGYSLMFGSTDITMSSVGDLTIEADSNDSEDSRFLNLKSGLNNLRVIGGSINSTNGLTYNENVVLHLGNYAPYLDSRYMNKTGDVITGGMVVDNTLVVNSKTTTTGLRVRRNASSVDGDDVVDFIVDDDGLNIIVDNDVDGNSSKFGVYRKFGGANSEVLYVDHTTGRLNGDLIFHDTYHPNADKWTTARTLTTTLTGDVSGTGSMTVDGTGNKTVTVAVTVANDSHTHDGRYYTESESNARFANVSGDTFTGNVTIDAGTSSTLDILCDDAGIAQVRAMGGNQGTGVLYVGQSSTHGGGLEYNGDGTPTGSGSGSDYITLFRRASGVDTWTARNKYSSNDWEFRGKVTAPTFAGALTGNASTASKLASARNIALSGDVSGVVSFDGSQNVIITTTISDDSHNHTIPNIDGLQSALDSKSDTTHGHAGLATSSWGGVRSQTSHGYIDFGPANTSYAHIYTDRPSFYFNKDITVNGTSVSMDGHVHNQYQIKDDTYEFTYTGAPSDDWEDTGIEYDNFDESGTYIVQVYANDTSLGFYSCYWSGVCSIHNTGKNDSWVSEIPLNFSGHATSGNRSLYLRNIMTTGNNASLGLQIKVTGATSDVGSFTFKFRKMI